jgi:hypothetical protein
MKLCELIDFDLFKIVPFTVIMSYRKDVYDKNMRSFTDLFTVMNDVKKRKNDLTTNPKGLNGISTNLECIFNKNYTDLFDIAGIHNFDDRKRTLLQSQNYDVNPSFFLFWK